MLFFVREKRRYALAGGFTLIELMVVAAIISLISSIVLASLDQARKKARDAVRTSELSHIRNAVELYITDHSTYPQPGNESSGVYTAASFTFGSPSGDLFWYTDGTNPSFSALLEPYTTLSSDPVNGRLDDTDLSYYYMVNAAGDTYDIFTILEAESNNLRCEVQEYVSSVLGGAPCSVGGNQSYFLQH
jgi:prepilin-type N-terminal cleavage/methylation domain-containing protein